MRRQLWIALAFGLLLAASCTREKNVYIPMPTPTPVPADADTGLGRHTPVSERW